MNNICEWATKNPLLQSYHNNEWGKIKDKDSEIIESLILETLQCGLSWVTVLNKRSEYRQAFFNFDLNLIFKNYTKYEFNLDEFCDFLFENFDIIKNKNKTKAIYSNCKILESISREQSLFEFFWSFTENSQIINAIDTSNNKPSFSSESIIMSQYLKSKGFKYVGEKVCYSFMESIGIINNHITTCIYK